MATLTGNKIKDTYSSLIKFSDNGTVDGTLQLLSDGAGNSIGISVDNSGNISSSAVGTLVGTTSSNVVNATMLDVSGNGSVGQSLLSDGDGSFSWGSPSVSIADGSITTAKLADDAVDSDKIADGAIDTVHIADSNITTAKIADDAISYAKMGAEFTTSAVISASDVDWSTAAVFTKTLSANTTLTFSNVSTGMVIDLVIDGNYTLTLPASVKEISGTYDGTVTNLIQIVSTNGATEQWATISKEA